VRIPTSYRGPALLCGLIVVGWAWDLVLGGGRADALGWLLALVLVGGVGLLAARGSLSAHGVRAAATSPTDEPHTSADLALSHRVIRPASPTDLAELADVDRAAAALFEVAGYGPPAPATMAQLQSAAVVVTAATPPVGYVRVDIVDGAAHISSLSVRPKFMKEGVGRSLVEYVCFWAVREGFAAVTVCAFADVPWSAKFYAELGFVTIDVPTRGLGRLLDDQAVPVGDVFGRRVAMCRRLPAQLRTADTQQPEAGTLGE
jgi:GNAT superfamily N-acetyltransferase